MSSFATDVSSSSNKQRKFISAVGKPGLARQARVAVAQAVRESAIQSLTTTKNNTLIPPLDYENFVVKNRTLLENDSHSEILFFPKDDLTESAQPQILRTTVCSVNNRRCEEARSSLFAQECLKTYTNDWNLVHFNYDIYGTDFAPLVKNCPSENLNELQYEIDLIQDESVVSQESQENDASFTDKIVKEGFLSKGPESAHSDQVLFKAFKRRYCILRRDLDSSYKIDFYKDKPKSSVTPQNAKATIYLDLCVDIVKLSKKSKFYLDMVLLSENRKTSIYLTADTEQSLDEWLAALYKIIEKNRISVKSAKTDDNLSIESIQTNESDSSSKEESITCIKPPDYTKVEICKFCKETEERNSYSLSVHRENVFAVYSNLEPFLTTSNYGIFSGDKIKPLSTNFGVRFLVECKGISIKLPLPGDLGESQLEPFFVSMFLFDARDGTRLSETFYCDVNPPAVKQYLPCFQATNVKSLPSSRKQSALNESPKKQSAIADALFSVELFGESSDYLLKIGRKALFSVTHPHSDTYLVVRIDKVLQGSVQSGQESYLKHDAKMGQKMQKSMSQLCSKLGHYRMPFVWTAKPVFQQFIGGTESARDSICLYRQDATKLNDEELTKLISELKKNDKNSRLSVLPNSSININIDVAVKPETLRTCLTSTLLPVVPFEKPDSNGTLTFEVESFPCSNDTIVDLNPYVDYMNNFFVYPISLKYDSQRSFSKARNLCCLIEFRDSDVLSHSPLKCIYGRPCVDNSTFVNHFASMVVHHETSPQYYDEVKIALPAHLTEKHHLLFTFCHIGVESSLNQKIKKETMENCVGYAWLPLTKNGRVVEEVEFSLPVAAHLPDGYLKCEFLGFNKGFSGPDVKWVDGGKQLFRICTRLCSTVMTRDPHLQTFFQSCQRFMECGTFSDGSSPDKIKEISTSDASPTNNLNDMLGDTLSKNFVSVDTRCLVNFMPTIFNHLFALLESATTEDFALHTVRALAHSVNQICQANKREILRSYIKFNFTISENQEKTVHEELLKACTLLLRPNQTEQITTILFLKNLWWFLDVVIKSMCLRLLRSGRIKMFRTERVSAEFLYRVDLFVQTLVSFLTTNYKDFQEECRSACHSLSFFLRSCLSLIDRGFIFQSVHFVISKFDDVDSKTLKQYKIDFLQILCQHEHFVALNLPVLITKNGLVLKKSAVLKVSSDGSVLANSTPTALTKTRYGGLFQRLLSLGAGMFSTNMSNHESGDCSSNNLQDSMAADAVHELRLSDEFCANHFLVGLLLRTLNLSMTESKDIRKRVICVLRNLLAKHSFDQRYREKHMHRIAALYFPLISILIEHAPFLDVARERDNASPGDTLNSNVGMDYSKRTTLTGDVSLASPSFSRTEHPRQISVEHIRHSIDVDVLRFSKMKSAETISMDTTQSVGDASQASESTITTSKIVVGSTAATSVPSLLAHTPHFLPYSRFDEDEIKDLLISALFVLKNVSDVCLGWFWQQCNEAELVAFLRILELALDLFKYEGKQRIIKANFNKLRSSNKTLRLSPSRDTTIISATEFKSRTVSERKRTQQPTFVKTTSVSADFGSSLSKPSESPFSVLQEAHLSQEVGFIVLDCLSSFAVHQKNFLSQTHQTKNDFLNAICTLLLQLVQARSSAELVQRTLSTLRTFVKNHSNAFLFGSTQLCNELCRKLLDCCNWSISLVQMEACSFLYLLMRLNFESTGRKKFNRIHQQIIISLSQLLGDGNNLNNPVFNRALSILNSFANADKTNAVFAAEVKDVVRRQRVVLMATSQLKEHTDDPEMLADLQKSLADGYAQSPQLRETWLQNLARHHSRYSCWAEAAHCYLHIIVLVCTDLQKTGQVPQISDFAKQFSDNISADQVITESSIDSESYDEDALITFVHECARYTIKAERYESLGHLYRLIIPIYEKRCNYEALADVYGTLQDSYTRVVDVMKSGRRILGSYFRVVFYNQALFEQQHDIEYIYREPKLTTLAEMADKLKMQFSLQFGADNVKLITDSSPVVAANLDPKTAYIQITHVEPFDDDNDGLEPRNEYQRQTNVRRFVYETPFTAVDGRARSSSVAEQFKRRTVLLTSNSFPYVVRRIPVVGRKVEDLNPLQTAIEELKMRTLELKKIVVLTPNDIKHLQLRLQGCVLPTVNAGPLAYAEAFCRKEEVEKYGLSQWDNLKDTFKAFVFVCYEALELNERLIGSDQMEYHLSMVKYFREMTTKLNNLFNDQMLILNTTDVYADASLNRDSIHRPGSSMLFDYIGGV